MNDSLVKNLEIGEDHVRVEDVLGAAEDRREDGVKDGPRREVTQPVRHPASFIPISTHLPSTIHSVDVKNVSHVILSRFYVFKDFNKIFIVGNITQSNILMISFAS